MVMNLYNEFLRCRLIQLRIEKGISARDMSLSIGQSESYINKIENKKALPSMDIFFVICEYFNIHPKDFSADCNANVEEASQLLIEMSKLDKDILQHFLALAKALQKK